LADRTDDEGYSTLLFPAMISKDRAPNFRLPGEKAAPEREEAWKALYLLTSSVQIRDTLLNLDNVDESGRTHWRTILMPESGAAFYTRIMTDLRLRTGEIGPFYLSLLAIAYWVYDTKSKLPEEYGLKNYIAEARKKYGFNDATTLVTYNMGMRTEKEVHYFSKLNSFIIKWFGDYIRARENNMSLITFLDSLTRSSSKSTNLKLLSKTREKLAYHLLKSHRINGELLDKLTQLRIQDMQASKRVLGVFDAQSFFSKLAS
jgi:hypothetical protein